MQKTTLLNNNNPSNEADPNTPLNSDNTINSRLQVLDYELNYNSLNKRSNNYYYTNRSNPNYQMLSKSKGTQIHKFMLIMRSKN